VEEVDHSAEDVEVVEEEGEMEDEGAGIEVDSRRDTSTLNL